MKTILLILTLFIGYALAIPYSNRLITPNKVEVLPSGKVLVTYTLPCKYDDWSQIVMTNDDSGDQVAAVGVVYSADKSVCHPERLPQGVYSQVFSKEVDPKLFGYTSEDTFAPMPTDN